MQVNSEPCHGVVQCLCSGSKCRLASPLLRPWQRLGSYATWHVENLGWRRGLARASLSVMRRAGGRRNASARERQRAVQETLGLEPGELVEVRPVEEIMATLDGNRRHKGLLWMTGMRKYCGKQYRVHRKVERIMLESNGQLRSMKNTVLLEGVMCDGSAFGGCDRSCFHFWREAWLKRVPKQPRKDP
jgi:hypothetical protein